MSNPSAIFLNRGDVECVGSVVMAIWKGRALCWWSCRLWWIAPSSIIHAVWRWGGHNRLAMLLAVLHRHGGVQMSDQDVFVNVVGGVRSKETGADLPLILAMVSSLRDKPLPGSHHLWGSGLIWQKSGPCLRGRRDCKRR